MQESLSRLKYGPPYLAKVLFTIAMQAQAQKCRNKNVFLHNAVGPCACALVVIMPENKKLHYHNAMRGEEHCTLFPPFLTKC